LARAGDGSASRDVLQPRLFAASRKSEQRQYERRSAEPTPTTPLPHARSIAVAGEADMSRPAKNRRQHPRAYTFSSFQVAFDELGLAVPLVDLGLGGFAILAPPEIAGLLAGKQGVAPVTLTGDGLRLRCRASLVNSVDQGHGVRRLGFNLLDLGDEGTRALGAALAELQAWLADAEAVDIGLPGGRR
jgi:PilZ domain